MSQNEKYKEIKGEEKGVEKCKECKNRKQRKETGEKKCIVKFLKESSKHSSFN